MYDFFRPLFSNFVATTSFLRTKLIIALRCAKRTSTCCIRSDQLPFLLQDLSYIAAIFNARLLWPFARYSHSKGTSRVSVVLQVAILNCCQVQTKFSDYLSKHLILRIKQWEIQTCYGNAFSCLDL